jgi:hypothetical protein
LIQSGKRFKAIWLWWFALPAFGLMLAGLGALALPSYPPSNLGGSIGALVGIGFLVIGSAITALIIIATLLIKTFAPRPSVGQEQHASSKN